MLLHTKGIVFRAIKHKESSLILHIYTEEKGLRSFIVNGVRKPKSRMGASLFQPGTILDLEIYFHENKDINRIKEAKPILIYKTIPFDVVRGGLMLFLVEVMHKCIKESEKNSGLFDFLEYILTKLDDPRESIAYLPLEFMMNLCQYLGFFPPIDNYNEGQAFDMIEMIAVPEKLNADTDFSYEMCQTIYKYVQGKDWIEGLSKEKRVALFEKWLVYYKIHIHNFHKPKSYEILKEIFS